MATAEQIKALIRSYMSDDPEQFYSVSLQIAAHEATRGHGALAHEIRGIVDKARKESQNAIILQFPQDMHGLLLTENPQTPISALVMPIDLKNRINRIIHEFRQKEKLKRHGLSHRRKVMLVGPPGTGKTMTARILSHEMRLALYTIQVDRLVTKFMGETSSKLRQIFDLIKSNIGVYLFDEFDAIGGERSLDNDVGEMRRVLNSFLQFIEQDNSDSIIVAATNNSSLLDRALFRRFDDVLYFNKPNSGERKQLIFNVTGNFLPARPGWKMLTSASNGLSQAEIDQACRDAIKQAILADKKKVTSDLLEQMFKERKKRKSVR